MSISEDIKRILWHEMGHLCVDILKKEDHNQLEVNLLNLSFTDHHDDLFKWSGYVEILPSLPFIDIPKNHSLMAYSLISLGAGCIFETIYFNEIKGDESMKFEDSFSFNKESIGNGDWRNYEEIMFKMRELYPNFRGKIDLLEYMGTGFLKIVHDTFFTLSDFIIKLSHIIDEEVIKIEGKFTKHNPSTGEFSYNYSGEDLNHLIQKIIPLMDNNGFRYELKNIHDTFIINYSVYIDKYS
jgi:hypothetical protein